MSEQSYAMKVCKYCQSEIPVGAKICPNCRNKTGGRLKWIIIGVIIFFVVVIGAAAGSGDNNDGTKKVGEISTVAGEEGSTGQVTEKYYVGDIIEDGDLKITFVSAGEYKSGNQFFKPKDGYMYYRFEFEVENLGKSDTYIGYQFDCYADGVACEKSYVGEDTISAEISSGRKAKGAVYYEVPKDAQSIEVEYESNFWTSKHIIFVAK